MAAVYTRLIIFLHLLLSGQSLRPTPGINMTSSIQFQLYTRSSGNDYLVLKDLHHGYDPKKETVVLIHGFLGYSQSPSMSKVRDALLAVKDLNVVMVDWHELARGPSYDWALKNARYVAQDLGGFLDRLMTHDPPPTQGIHIIGVSLGALVAGYTSDYFTKGKINRITALDPSRTRVDHLKPGHRLDKDDAHFVMAIHTGSDNMGSSDAVGHADFYPNSGHNPQPGCKSNSSSNTDTSANVIAYEEDPSKISNLVPRFRPSHSVLVAGLVTTIILSYISHGRIELLYKVPSITCYSMIVLCVTNWRNLSPSRLRLALLVTLSVVRLVLHSPHLRSFMDWQFIYHCHMLVNAMDDIFYSAQKKRRVAAFALAGILFASIMQYLVM